MVEDVGSSPEMEAEASAPAVGHDDVEAVGISPKKRRRTSTVTSGSKGAGAEPMMSIAAAMELPVVDSKRLCCEFEAFLVEYNASKEVSRGPKGQIRRVMHLVVADSSMLVAVDVWSPVCEVVEKLISEANHLYEDNASDPQYLKLRFGSFQRVVVSTDPPVFKFQSIKQSVVRTTGSGTLALTLNRALFVTSFAGYGRAGVKINLLGTLTSIEPATMTKDGVPMRSAMVTDDFGISLELKLYDGWALEELAVGDVIVGMYLVSQLGIQGQHGFYWVYSDSYLMQCGKKVAPATRRVEYIPAEQEEP